MAAVHAQTVAAGGFRPVSLQHAAVACVARGTPIDLDPKGAVTWQ